MKLENQVCSLELARHLKSLGIKEKSLWVWEGSDDTKWYIAASAASGSNIYAYSVAELGEMLPAYLIPMAGTESEMRFDLNEWKDAGWHVGYWWDEDTRRNSGMTIENTLELKHADARAKMLVFLIENDLITLK